MVNCLLTFKSSGIFNIVINHMMDSPSAQAMCGASYGKIHLANLGYADDIAILAEIIEVVHLVLDPAHD